MATATVKVLVSELRTSPGLARSQERPQALDDPKEGSWFISVKEFQEALWSIPHMEFQ